MILKLAVLSLFLAPVAALAEDEVIERVVVRNRLFDLGGRPELAASLGFMPVTRLTDHWTLSATAAYNFSSQLAVELRGGGAYTRQTGLARQIARQFLERDPALGIDRADDLSDAWEMRGHLSGGLRWAPIYGKLSLLSELPLHFHAYMAAGGGAGAFHRQSLVYCRALLSRGEGTCGDWLREDKIAGLFTVAVGMRLFATRHGSFRLEIRDYSFPDSYLVNIDRQVAEAGGVTGQRVRAGFTHLVLFDAGYALAF